MNIDHYCLIWVFMPHKIRTFSWRFFRLIICYFISLAFRPNGGLP